VTESNPEPAFFDFAATTRVDGRVADVVMHYMREEFGNSGSRTHAWGTAARNAVEAARRHIAAVVEADPDEVILTSGATESNNIAILGLADFADQSGRRHIISTRVEHKAVLEPLEHLQSRGFEVTLLDPMPTGAIDPQDLQDALRPDTLLVSVMHVNNETGVIQPLDEITQVLVDHDAYFHVDAAQGYGKELVLLRDQRIDLISISGHKIYAPKGVGALITRKRHGVDRPPLKSLMFGGGQERGLRPGTVPVALAAGLGEAARVALIDHDSRIAVARRIETEVVEFVMAVGGDINGDRSRSIPHIVNASFKGLDSEAFIVATKNVVAVSNGAACSSHSYERSHVLEAMNLEPWRVGSAVRFSFSHENDTFDSNVLMQIIDSVRF
jgi:cysteine desulfurase